MTDTGNSQPTDGAPQVVSLSLPVSTVYRSPYFPTIAMRKIGAGRDTKIIETTMLKVYVDNLFDVRDEHADTVRVALSGLDTSGETFTFDTAIDVSYSGPIILDPVMTDVVNAAIVDWVFTNYSVTITANDVEWKANALVAASDYTALMGRIKSGIIHGETTGTTTVFTVEDSRIFLVNEIYIWLRSVDSLVSAPVIKIGSYNPNYDQFGSGIDLSSLTEAGMYMVVRPQDGNVNIAGTQSLRVTVTTAAVADDFWFEVIVTGVYSLED